MLGFGAIGKFAIGEVATRDLPKKIAEGERQAALTVSSLIIPEQRLIVPERRNAEGLLIKSTSVIWAEIVRLLGSDWSVAYELPPEKWEELIAGAFKKAGYDEVTLTPRSGDHGRDVIAIKHGVGCVKIIDSVKAYKPGNLVSYDDVRALIGVMTGERDVSKGIVTTTSDFPPKIADDPFISSFLPTRLELMNGVQLRQWLADLSQAD